MYILIFVAIIVVVWIAIKVITIFDLIFGGQSSGDRSRSDYQSRYDDYDVTYGDEDYLAGYYSGFVDQGYDCFEIKGTSFRGLSKSDVGTFDGKAIAETNNIYDNYAIAIYGNYGKLLGYIPKGQKDIHQYILSKGGEARAVGYINGNKKFFWGKAYVEFDYNAWAELLPEEERVYARANLREHYMIVSDIDAKKGIFYGIAKPMVGLNEPFPIGIYNEEGVKIGVVIGEMRVYFTIKLKENGEVPVWGRIGRSESFVYIPVLCGPKKIANAKAKFEEQFKK